jgi:hypothetical protein
MIQDWHVPSEAYTQRKHFSLVMFTPMFLFMTSSAPSFETVLVDADALGATDGHPLWMSWAPKVENTVNSRFILASGHGNMFRRTELRNWLEASRPSLGLHELVFSFVLSTGAPHPMSEQSVCGGQTAPRQHISTTSYCQRNSLGMHYSIVKRAMQYT